MSRLILTVPGEDAPAGGDMDVVGTSTGGEVITVVSGNVRFDPSFNLGGDTIDLPGNASTFTVARSGSNAIFVGNGATVEVPIGATGLTVQFNDVSLVLRVNGQTPQIGNQTITNTATAINPNTPPAAIADDTPTMAEIMAPDDGVLAAQFEGLKAPADFNPGHFDGGERFALAVNHAFQIQDFIV